MAYNKMYNNTELGEEILRLERQAKTGYKKELRNLKSLGLKDGMSILEVGSGPGFYTELLLESFPNSQIVGIDNDSTYIDLSKKRLEPYGEERVMFINQSITNNNINNNIFDCVIVRFVIQHLEQPYKAIEEIYRILKPGGIVVVIDIDDGIWGLTEPESNLIRTVNNNFATFQRNNGGNRNIGRYLIKMFKKCGFVKLDMEGVIKHSDLEGIEGLIGKGNNPQINNFFYGQQATLMLISLIAKGMKPFY